jgi:predicted dehydrogenase
MIRTALIGCGRIGALLENDPLRNKPCTHYGGMEAAGISPAYACDADPDRLAEFGRRAGLHREDLFHRHRALLKERTPEIVVIATWTQSHARITIDAAEAGARVVVCEKPIAADLRDARKMIDACKSNAVTLIINHERRFDPRYIAAKKLLDRGVIGRLVSARGFLPAHGYHGSSESSYGGGPLLHDGTHLVDILAFFAGKITHIEGGFSRVSRKSGFEDHAWATLHTIRGIPIQIAVGGGMSYFGFLVELFGEKGKIEIGNGVNRLFTTSKSRFYTGFRDLEEISFPAVKGNCFANLYREAKKILRKPGKPTSSGDDGYAALEIVHAAYLSAHSTLSVDLPLSRGINLKKIFALTR